MPPTGDQAFIHVSLCGTFHIQTIESQEMKFKTRFWGLRSGDSVFYSGEGSGSWTSSSLWCQQMAVALLLNDTGNRPKGEGMFTPFTILFSLGSLSMGLCYLHCWTVFNSQLNFSGNTWHIGPEGCLKVIPIKYIGKHLKLHVEDLSSVFK